MAEDLPPSGSFGSERHDDVSAGLAPARSLEALESFLRVIRIPREDVRAMVAQVGPEATGLFDRTDGHGAPANPDGPARFDALPERVRSLYALADSPRAATIGAGREVLLREALANLRDERFASTVALVITQIDGVAADVPPTPGAAFPFVVADPRPRDAPDALLPAAVVASHPGALVSVATLMRTARPDSGPTDAVHRHGIMHGRDLGFGTRELAHQVLGVLASLVDWAEPVVQARVAAGRVRR